jgi:hypothetical protein
MYSCTLSLTSALNGEVCGQRHAPDAISQGKTRYPLCRRLGGPQGQFGRFLKTPPPTGFRSPACPARSESIYRLMYSFWTSVLDRCERSVTGYRCIQDAIIAVSTSSRAAVRGTCSVNPAPCLTCSRLLRNI